MSNTEIRTSELDKWSVLTRICGSLEQAEAVAEEFLRRTSHIVLWPMKQDQWLVIAKFHILLN